MNVISVGPFLTGSLFWRSAPSLWMLTVLAKATFSLRPGKVSLAAEQQSLHGRERHWSDDPARSLHAPSDLLPFKRRVDVVLVGQAFAPRGVPAQSLVARLAVGDIDKAIAVHADRALTWEGEVREGARWTSMPLVYERAGGGPDTWNPVGVSLDAPPDAYGQRLLPNLRPRAAANPDPSSLATPIGFGPIAAGWPVRREKLRHRAESWSEVRFEDALIGDDFDEEYFQGAPADQQLDALRDEEAITLENLSPEHPLLVTQLSGLQPKAFVDIPGQTPRDLHLVADTLWIDTDRAICTVTWRGQVPLVGRDQPGRVLVAATGPGQHLSWANLTALLKATGGDADVTIARGEEGSAPLLTSSAAPPRDVTITSVGKAPTAAVLPFAPLAVGVTSPIAAPSPAAPRAPSSGPRATLEVRVPEGALGAPPWLNPPHREPVAGSMPVSPSPPRAPASIPPPRPVSVSTASVSAPPIVEPSLAPSHRGAPPPPAPAPPPAPPPPPRIVAEDRIDLGGVDERALAKAAFAGVAAASDAAAGGTPAARRDRLRAEPRASSSARALLELIWFDPAFVARIRQVPAWAALLKPPPKKAASQRGAPPPPPDPPSAAEVIERADVAAVIAKAPAARLAEIDASITEALGAEGSLEAPLLVVEGDLELGLDRLALLKSVTSAAAPLAGADKRLKEALDLATEMLKTDLEFAPETIDRLLTRMREAWSKANHHLPPDHLEALPERMLLERRQYVKRELLDGTWIRAGLTLDGVVVPVYLPDALSKRLPLYRRFEARVIVEALPQQDQYEASPIALRVVALGRALPSPATPQRA